MAARNTKKKNVRLWSDSATRDLIDLWGEESIQQSLDSSKSSKQTRAIYQSLLVGFECLYSSIHYVLIPILLCIKLSVQ